MADIELFNKLRLDTWFKYLLYLGGVLLVASLFTSSSLVKSVQSFAIWTIIVGIIAWIIAELSLMGMEYYENNYDTDGVIGIGVIGVTFSILLLIIWILIIALPFIGVS